MAKKKPASNSASYAAFFHALLIGLLTVLTQVGGAIWLLALLLGGRKRKGRRLRRLGWFSVLYLGATFLLIPMLALQFGRAALPVWGDDIRPASILYPLLNRHYLTQASKHTLLNAAQPFLQANPAAEIRYLDAGFPFFKGFPLLPHLSHNDGRKLDLAFYYRTEAGEPARELPSRSGYGVFVEPTDKEFKAMDDCRQKGYWQYGYAQYLSFGERKGLVFDENRTRELLNALLEQPRVEKIFLEPHLKTRLGLQQESRIRFHGCQAVRHDDHLHINFR
jgi:hypothetical protein